VHHYKKVLYQNIYPNIDVEFCLGDGGSSPSGRLGGAFKYNFIVHPGGNPNDIQLKIDGANATSLTNEGHITIETAYGNIDESLPLSYQLDENNNQQVISANFKLLSTDNHQLSTIYGIGVGNYDATKTLIIDPWATYYGGSSGDLAHGIAVDSIGNSVITGRTGSASGIATTGAYQTSYGGNNDAFIAKFNASGARQWATYYGGSGDDGGNGIAIDGSGNSVIIGATNSTSGMATSGAYQTSNGGNNDVFIAKFNASGARQWATYYGGSGDDYGSGIAVDGTGNIVITGYSYSTSGIATTGAYQTSYGGGNWDAFIAKFNASGARQWATYYGGSGDDDGLGIAIDGNGNIVITGYTYSTSGIATTGANQISYGGGSSDAFIAKFNTSGARQWATYYGGSNYDYGYGVAIDGSGNIVITGYTASTSGIATTGAYQTSGGGTNYDAFIAKFNASGARQWATYYGGSGGDNSYGIAVDSNGNIMITGYTASTSGIATTNAYQSSGGGTYTDAFIAKFNPAGARQWATYYGGSNDDYCYGIAVDGSGNMVITGSTYSTSGIATTGAYQTSFGGGFYDAFIASFTSGGGLPVQLTSFDAKLVNKNGVLCTWQTASELNNDRFEIERSLQPTANSQWQTVGKVKGNGTTSSVSSYQFTDALSTNNYQPSTIYYRLRQVDFDGKSSLSDVRVLKLNEVNDEINIYPNPTNDVLTISIATQSSSTSIQLFDITGRNVKSINTQNNTNQIDVGDLCNGIYFINICNPEMNVSRKIIINK
jgi:hypothetical protein